MGGLSVDGMPVRGSKPLELVTALCLSGGQMTRSALARRIYMSAACDSAIPTLCYRARKLGISVEFDAARAMYRLSAPVVIDALQILELADHGDAHAALDLWSGPCLASSDTPLAASLRLNVDKALSRAVLDSADPDLLHRAARITDSVDLAEAALTCEPTDRRPDPWSTVLIESFLEGTLA